MKRSSWRNIGTEVNGNSVQEIILQAGLDYEVVKEPIYTGAGEMVPDSFVTRVKDESVFFGTVGGRYEVIQNAEAFSFIDNMVNNGLVFEKAGQTASGMVYIIASLENFNIFGDAMKPYIIFQNSHDGSIPMKAALTTLRLVCENQFSVAFKDAANTVKIRHTFSANARMHEAEKVMQEAILHNNKMSELANELNSIKLNAITANKIAVELFPYKENDSKVKVERAENARAEMLKILRYDNDLANHKNTGWGMLNAYSDYMTHAKPNRATKNWEEARFMKLVNGDMNNAVEIIKSIA